MPKQYFRGLPACIAVTHDRMGSRIARRLLLRYCGASFLH